MNIKLAALAIALLAGSSAANATVFDYTISGVGSGSLNGAAFTNTTFVFTSVGDDANYADHGAFASVDPLASTELQISGFAAVTLQLPTRLFSQTTDGSVGLSRAGNGGNDLFDFLTPGPVNLDSLFGPIGATSDAEALNQFQNVGTSGGDLTFNSATSITFSDSGGAGGGVPEPATWGLMTLGLGLMGAAMRRRGAVTA